MTPITSEFNFMKKSNTLLAQFLAIIYGTIQFKFYEKTKKLLTRFWVII